MAEPRPQLDSLPVEVIRRIAASSSCIDALNLMKVNRNLYRNCRDWNVFQQQIRGNGDGRTERLDWDPSFLTPQTHPIIWVRYALADQHLSEFLLQRVRPTESFDTRITLYTPQLIVAHHPLLNLQAVKSLCKLFYSKKFPDAHGLAFAFILTACVLSAFRPEDQTNAGRLQCYKALTGYDDEIDNNEASLSQCLWYMLPIPSTRTPGDMPGANFVNNPFDDKTLLKAYMALPFFYFELQMALAANNFFHPEGANPEDLPAELPVPPISANIPFSSFLDNMPLPFASNSPELFTKSHIPLMTSASFLSSGTWTGYLYTNTPHVSNSPRFQYPMFSVQFHPHIDADIPHEVLFNTTGKMFTAKGSFDWSGILDSRTGKIDMDARYHGDVWIVPLSWQAVMTPFGIVGSMGGSRHAHWMWLWKEEWCAVNAHREAE